METLFAVLLVIFGIEGSGEICFPKYLHNISASCAYHLTDQSGGRSDRFNIMMTLMVLVLKNK